MRKIFLIVLFASLTPLLFLSNAHNKLEHSLTHDVKMQWWREAKFGMFIHWGPYSLYGGIYNGYKQQYEGAEWIMNRCKIPVREYKAKATTFNPTEFNAEEIVLLAKSTGMKYIIITTKHHDGFAMFKSNASNFNIVDYTPFGRDVIGELAEACRIHNMKLGFYYSQSQDWCNPGGATRRKLMLEGWANPDSTEINNYTKINSGAWDCLQRSVTFENYFYNVSLPQIKELLTNYGDIAVMWWDTPMDITDKLAEEVTAELAKYPQIITNDRLKFNSFPGDYKTPEERIPKLDEIKGVDWETCMNIGDSWGYKSYEDNWKSSETIIRNLLTIIARGGNYLLNIGPTPEGTVPKEAVERLNEVGNWISINGESIYGAQRSPIHPLWGQCTLKDKGKKSTLYLCVFDWPPNGKLIFDANYKVKKASFLHNGSKLVVKKRNNQIIIDVPIECPDEIATVIKLELNEKLPTEKIALNN